MMHIGLHVAKVRREMESITSSMLFIEKKGVPDHRRKKNWHSRPSPSPKNKGFFPPRLQKKCLQGFTEPWVCGGKGAYSKDNGMVFSCSFESPSDHHFPDFFFQSQRKQNKSWSPTTSGASDWIPPRSRTVQTSGSSIVLGQERWALLWEDICLEIAAYGKLCCVK